MLDLVRKLEQAVTMALIAMMAVIVLLATVELGWTIAKDVVAPPLFFPGIDKLLEGFGKFLLVLIGIELLETMRAFAHAHVVRVEVVLSVAMIAVARKIVVFEPDHMSPITLLGIAATLAALAVAYRIFVPLGRPSARGVASARGGRRRRLRPRRLAVARLARQRPVEE
jgi:uncharacterized membrane protein (DUF373 family)